MGNRLPIYALAALVIIAIIWRIASPKPPIPPGPLGGIPNWSSSGKIGEMGPSGVNPAGDKWAGAWNQITDNKELRSAVWFIDFNKEEAKYCLLDKGSYTSSLSWGDNNTVRALVNDSDKPATIEQSKIITINAADARKIDSKI